jgi:hypothetical protein
VVYFEWLRKCQNNRYWSTENPLAVRDVSLHGLKVGVWCAVSAQRIIGPAFFHETVSNVM